MSQKFQQLVGYKRLLKLKILYNHSEMQKTFTVGLLAASVLSQDVPANSTRVYPRVNPSKFNFGSYGGYSRYGSYGSYGRLRGSAFSRGYGGSTQSKTSVVSSALSNARSEAQLSTSYRSTSSIFSKIPSMNQVDPLIKQANRMGLMRVIQKVATDQTLKCDQKLAYLSEIFGRIRVALENQKFQANSTNIRADATAQAIARYSSEKGRVEAQLAGLNIDENRKNLTDLLAQLSNAYREYNENKQMIFPVKNNITSLNKRVDTLKAKTQSLRESRENDRLKMAEVQMNVQKLMDKIANAKQAKNELEFQVNSSTSLVENNNQRITESRNEISALEEVIDKLNAQADQLQLSINNLDVEVKTLGNKISITEVKTNNYQEQIDKLQMKINHEKENVGGPEIGDLQLMIAALEELQNTVERDTSMHYYNCVQRDVERENIDGVVVYIVRGSRFNDYLMNGYGSSIFNAGINIQSGVDHTFRDVDIFGGNWAQQYGYPFPPDSLGGDSNVFDIPGSFNCLQPSAATQGIGTISNIDSNRIGVATGHGNNVQLNLGSCSSLESTSIVPQIGQVIAFSGVNTGNGYNLYKASCWQQ